MKEQLEFNGRALEILRRPCQRNMNLRVRRDGRLHVSCARDVPKREIFSFILEQQSFIEKCLAEYAEEARKFPPRKFESGETFFFEGARIPLEIVWSWSPRIRVTHLQGAIEMVAPLTSTRLERQKALFSYYRRRARTVLLDRVLFWSARMGLYPATVTVRGQRTRWGSCSSKGELSLNWKLLAVPFHVMEYVLIHELAHLKHLNHSPRFWSLVEQYCPEYKAAKRWLRENEAGLNIQFQKFSKPL